MEIILLPVMNHLNFISFLTGIFDFLIFNFFLFLGENYI